MARTLSIEVGAAVVVEVEVEVGAVVVVEVEVEAVVEAVVEVGVEVGVGVFRRTYREANLDLKDWKGMTQGRCLIRLQISRQSASPMTQEAHDQVHIRARAQRPRQEES